MSRNGGKDLLEPIEVGGLLGNLLRRHARSVHPLSEETQVRGPRAELLNLAEDTEDGEFLVGCGFCISHVSEKR